MTKTLWDIRSYSLETGNLMGEREGASTAYLQGYLRGWARNPRELAIVATPIRPSPYAVHFFRQREINERSRATVSLPLIVPPRVTGWTE